MADYRIRKAEEKDCEQLLKLIVELAEFQNLLHEVHTTIDALKEDGFGTDSCFHCLVAETTSSDGAGNPTLVGYSLFYYTYPTWAGKTCHMEDLYVNPAWRSKGIGTALWAEVAKTALSNRCKQLQWTALAWNTHAIDIYKGRGGVNLTDTEGLRHFFRMTKGTMETFVAQNERK